MAPPRPCWDPAPKPQSPSPFYTSTGTKYGRILVKMNYDYHYKWVGRAGQSTDCRTSPETLKQLKFIKDSERWKPSKDNQHLKKVEDQWMDHLIRTAKPGVDTKVTAHVERYAEYRRANPSGRPSIVERYVQKRILKNHKDNLKKMKPAVDSGPPKRAMQFHDAMQRQPFTRTGILKRPKSQQSRTQAVLAELKSAMMEDMPPLVQLPGRRRPTTAPAPKKSAVKTKDVDDRHVSPQDSLERSKQYPRELESAGSMVSSGVHLPISAAREVLDGHAFDLGFDREHEDGINANTWQQNIECDSNEDTTMRAAVRWPPEIPSDSVAKEDLPSKGYPPDKVAHPKASSERRIETGWGENDKTPSCPRRGSSSDRERGQDDNVAEAEPTIPCRNGPSKAAMAAHRQWLATASWASAAKNAADAAEAARAAAEAPSETYESDFEVSPFSSPAVTPVASPVSLG